MSFWMAFVGIPISFAVVGFVAGLIGPRYPRVPWIATAGMVLGYFLLLAIVGVWASRCPGCFDDTEETRLAWLAIAAGMTFWLMLGLIAVVWLGVAFNVLVRSALLWVRWSRAGDEDSRAKLEAGRRA